MSEREAYLRQPGNWFCEWLIEKWSVDQVLWAERKTLKADPGSSILRRLVEPEESPVYGNLLLTEGVNAMLLLLTGGSATAYNNTNARVGVGDSSTAASAAQTDLQAATNKLYKAMNATYPQVSTNTVTFQSDFLTAEANFAWNEWTIDNGAAAAKNLNRVVQSVGTKSSGTWTLTAQVTIS